MKQFQTIVLLILVMVIVVGIVVSATFSILYDTAFDQKRSDLIQTAKSQARLIEAAMRHQEVENPEGAWEHTLLQIKEAHRNYEGFGEPGEFTLARRGRGLCPTSSPIKATGGTG